MRTPSPIAVVAPLVQTRLVRLPAWFTVDKALRVAELRDVDHVLIEEQGRVRGAASRARLAQVAPGDPVARWIQRCEVFLVPHTPVPTARDLMRAEGVSCLPVVSNGLLVGTVSLSELEGAGDDAVCDDDGGAQAA